MRIARIPGSTLVTVVALCSLMARPAQAADSGHWADSLLHLGLSYPAYWKTVPEHGARLKLLSPDAAGEFEVIALPVQLAPDALARQAGATLAGLHCATKVVRTSGPVGHLGVMGFTATGTCTGGDLGWRLAITAFDHNGHAALVRSWLFHAQRRDAADVAAIVGSLAPIGR